MGLTALTLERSKGAPLQLWLSSVGFFDRATFCDLITPYIQNVETMRLNEFTKIEDLTQVLPNFPQSTPNLRSLVLTREVDTRRWDPSTDPFASFPNTLRSLTSYDAPIYPSFLRLRTLTKLSLHYYALQPLLDTLLDILEENRSLESVGLHIHSDEHPAQVSRRRAVALNRLRHLSITCLDAMTGRTLISNIPLRRGADLEITLLGRDTGLGLNQILSGISMTRLSNLLSPTPMISGGAGLGLNEILSGISMAHLSNLLSPALMIYRSSTRKICLIGPNGRLSYTHERSLVPPFTEFSVLPLTAIKKLHLVHSDPSVVFHPSSFPALETLTIKCNPDVSRLFSALLPDPSLFPSLRTLKFLDCVITEEFTEELTRFASSRKNTASAWLHHVEFIHRGGKFSTFLQLTD